LFLAKVTLFEILPLKCSVKKDFQCRGSGCVCVSSAVRSETESHSTQKTLILIHNILVNVIRDLVFNKTLSIVCNNFLKSPA
jgi:hypothetical protein